MIIGLIGDLHGRVFHAIAAVATWQRQMDKQFDLLIQVGDVGAFPDVRKLDPATNRYFAADPAEADFSRLLQAGGIRDKNLRDLREQLKSVIHFVRGNHEDFSWLERLSLEATTAPLSVDPYNLFGYVPDGTVLQINDLHIAFLGGVEERTDEAAIDRDAYQTLMDLEAGKIDLLVTHQGPYGSSVGHRGDIHGSHLISKLIEHIQPAFHVAGHAHCLSGPRLFGQTMYLGLDCLVASPIWHPAARGLQPGCLAVLDTEAATLLPVTDSWLSEFDTPFDFDAWIEVYKRNWHDNTGNPTKTPRPPGLH